MARKIQLTEDWNGWKKGAEIDETDYIAKRCVEELKVAKYADTTSEPANPDSGSKGGAAKPGRGKKASKAGSSDDNP